MRKNIKTLMTGIIIASVICTSFNVMSNDCVTWASETNETEKDYANEILTESKETDFVIEENVVTGYKGNAPKVVIPDGVTAIADNVFANHAEIRQVVFPDSLKKIGNKSFENCWILRNLDLNQVEEIGEYAFASNFLLKGIVIPSTVKTIGKEAFAQCHGLCYVIFENGITELGESAFCDSERLEMVKLPSTLKTIPAKAFSGSPMNMKVYVPKEVESISASAFAYIIDVSVGGANQDYSYDNRAEIYGYTDCASLKISTGTVDLGSDSVLEFYDVTECAIDEVFDYTKIDTRPTGDALPDGEINMMDTRLVLMSALGISTESQFALAREDVNQNGKIDLEDAQVVLKMALGIPVVWK